MNGWWIATGQVSIGQGLTWVAVVHLLTCSLSHALFVSANRIPCSLDECLYLYGVRVPSGGEWVWNLNKL